ncbi:MAG: hypothetical protein WBD40_18590 [Tepidisphaeraceae bacterium]
MSTADDKPLRFAVLRHEGIDEPHFDFLFETSPGSMLKTWRLKAWPVMEAQEAQPIRDHRPAFLTYQGTLSGDRGHVMRVDEGTCVAQTLARRVVVDLFPSGQRIVFDQPVDDTWFARVEGRSPDSAALRPGA